jgi:hypothetical protein
MQYACTHLFPFPFELYYAQKRVESNLEASIKREDSVITTSLDAGQTNTLVLDCQFSRCNWHRLTFQHRNPSDFRSVSPSSSIIDT